MAYIKEDRGSAPLERRVEYDEAVVESRYSPFARFVWTIVTIINGLLALRFLLRAFGANPAAGFTDFVYSITRPLVTPFANVIAASRVDTGILEWSTLLAIAVYWLVGYGIARLLSIPRPAAHY